jgi:hypothetical protein
MKVFEVRYIDNQFIAYTKDGKSNGFDVNLAKGKPVLIEAKTIEDAMIEALQRIRKKVDYSVGSVVRVV